MTDERKNEIWATLTPKEKADLQEIYNAPEHEGWDRGYNAALESIFGYHNLTAQAGEGNHNLSQRVANCDKSTETTQESQSEPKFKVGDIVKTNRGDLAIIYKVDYDSTAPYNMFGLDKDLRLNPRTKHHHWAEDSLELYHYDNSDKVAESQEDEGVIGRLSKKIEKLESDLIMLSSRNEDYAKYRTCLTTEIAVALINNSNRNTRYGDVLAHDAVKIANEIIKKLNDTEE